ncbi:hypothetical protein [Burkholderia territorii]|uniref:hypothetical protein n=1 Tax=Burkholderia territorii TaxID=1503055 RepID=UPI00075455AA|nr:hypothetical protein [Burkholderia territorii]KWA14891.1 hypothetical protein WT37_17545 [Burkholderia territorii]
MQLHEIETRDMNGALDVAYINPDHVLWMSQAPIAVQRTQSTAVRVDDRTRGGSLIIVDQPPIAQLLRALGPFVTAMLANPSSDYPSGLVNFRVDAIVKITTEGEGLPLAQRALGCIHVKDGSTFKVQHYRDVAAQLWAAGTPRF